MIRPSIRLMIIINNHSYDYTIGDDTVNDMVIMVAMIKL